MEIRKFILKRLVEIAIIFFVILTILFVLFRIAPGDPVSVSCVRNFSIVAVVFGVVSAMSAMVCRLLR